MVIVQVQLSFTTSFSESQINEIAVRKCKDMPWNKSYWEVPGPRLGGGVWSIPFNAQNDARQIGFGPP